MNYRIVKINEATIINLRGWKIVAPNGDSLQPFTTKAEAERIVKFFGSEVTNEPKS